MSASIRSSIVTVTILGILVMACGSSAVRAASQVRVVTIHSVALEKNLLGDPPDQQLAIYLPAEYSNRPKQRFAVVYFLHGFDDTPAPEVGHILQGIIGSDTWTRAAAFKSVSDLDSSLPRGTWSPMFAKDLLPVIGVAMSAAFAPQPDAPPFFGHSPFVVGPRGEQQPDPTALAAHQTHILTTALPSLIENALQLKGIFIEYGAEDEFTHIPVGARALSAAMAQAGIPHTLEAFTGSHGSQAKERIRDSVLPWFSSHLAHQ